MHALPKRESLGCMLPTTGDNLLSSVGDASVQTCGTTQIYEDLLSMLQTHQDHLTANGSQVLVGYTMHQRGQGVTVTPANCISGVYVLLHDKLSSFRPKAYATEQLPANSSPALETAIGGTCRQTGTQRPGEIC